jgi:hypothetical protein
MFVTSLLLFGSITAGFLIFGTLASNNAFFTPTHTNSFSFYGGLIGSTACMLSGAIFGLNIINFSIMAGVVRNFSLSIVHKIVAYPLVYIAPVGLALITLELLDKFKLFAVAPLCVGLGLLVTLAY